jgi:hypothetical protein
MATTRTYETATGISLGGHGATTAYDSRPQLRNTPAALERAKQAYCHAKHRSGTSTAFAFFIAAAIAVGTQGSAPLALLGFVALALLSAASGTTIGRHQFRA